MTTLTRLDAFGRRRAEREAERLVTEVMAALAAFRGGDAEAVHEANWAMARLMGLVFRHRLDLGREAS